MTREEKQKAIDALKISAPVKAVTQEEFNNYIQTLNKIMDWLEQDPCEVVLNKIRAEVESINVWALRYVPSKYKDMRPQIVTNVKNHVLEIIDKYRIK